MIKRWQCLRCFRRFIRAEAHKCDTGYRKHHIPWLVFDRRYKQGKIAMPKPSGWSELP